MGKPPRFSWPARPRPVGNFRIASWKSLVLPAPARPVPLLSTANSTLFFATLFSLPTLAANGHSSGTAEGRGLSPPASVVAYGSRRRKYDLLELDSGAS